MRNITALAFLVIMLWVSGAANSAYAQQAGIGGYVFSIGAQAGFARGHALEIVHTVPGQTKGELLSELIWDMKNVYYAGIQMDFGRRDPAAAAGFFSSLSFKYGFPADTGNLENRDWLSTENASLTDFSSHVNRTSQFFMVDAAIGITLPVHSNFYLKPFISGSWMRFAFSGRDGYGIYAREKGWFTYHPIDDNPITISFEGLGDVILYEQNWLLLAPGLAVGTNILSPFTFELSFKTSLFTYCVSRDDHLLRDITFLDYMRAGLLIEPALSVSYTMRRIGLSFELAYRRIGNARGQTYMGSDTRGYFLAPSQSGSGLSLLDSRFTVKLRI